MKSNARFIAIPALEPRPGTDFVWTTVSLPAASIKEIRKNEGGASTPWDTVQARVTMKDEMIYYTSLTVDELTEKLNA